MLFSTLVILAGLAGPVSPAPGSGGISPPQAAGAETQTAGQALSQDALGEAYFLYIQARQLLGAERFAEAEAAYKKVLAAAPDAADVRVELAVMYAVEMRGRVADAVSEAEAALASDPDNRGAHRILGLIQASVSANIPSPADASDMVDQAVGHLERAVEGPRDLGAELTLGELYLRQGNYPRAVAVLEAFVADQPDYAESRRNLATAYEATGRWTDAARNWAVLAEAGGRDATTYRLRQATATANAGDSATARDLLVGITAVSPGDPAAWYLLSQIELQSANLDAAEAAARKIIEIDANDVRGPLSLSDVLAGRGDFDAVVTLLEPRVSSPLAGDLAGGRHGRLAGALAAALQERGDDDAAVAVLEAARRRVPADDDLLYGLAAAYDRTGRTADAISALRDLIARVPGYSPALNYLGYMLADSGEQLNEAVGLIERAVALEPANPSYQDSLGWAYFKLGRFDEAREPLERAAAAMRSVSVVQDHLGDLYFQLKRYKEAADAYDRALAGDMTSLDTDAVTKKRDRARELAGR